MTLRSRISALGVLLCFGVVAACSSGGDAASTESSAEDRETNAAANPCEPEGDESVAKALVRCGDASVAYVSTPTGGGTGVVVEADGRRYLLTNAHVVDPYASVDVVVAKEAFESMPVVGLDVVSDVALLGPFDDGVDLKPIPLTASPEVERGDDMFVVGYPGELYEPDPDDLEPNIARGIMGRTRTDKEFELTYFQSDASIAAGQSGGGLFDQGGNLVGITSMSWADEYTLAVSSENVLASIESILAGDGHEYARIASSADDPGLVTEVDLVLSDELAMTGLYVPPSDTERSVEIRFSPAELVGVSASSSLGEMFAMSSAAADHLRALMNDQMAGLGEDLPDGVEEELDALMGDDVRAAEVEPGRFRFDLPADTDLSIEVLPLNDGERIDFSLTANVPFQVATQGPGRSTLDVGDAADVLVDHLLGAHVIEVELDEGQEVTVTVSTPADDVAFIAVDPGASLRDAVNYVESDGLAVTDDNFEGPMENEESSVFAAPESGLYRFVVHTFSGLTTLARVSIGPA